MNVNHQHFNSSKLTLTLDNLSDCLVSSFKPKFNTFDASRWDVQNRLDSVRTEAGTPFGLVRKTKSGAEAKSSI